jgi:hypothetical protein
MGKDKAARAKNVERSRKSQDRAVDFQRVAIPLIDRLETLDASISRVGSQLERLHEDVETAQAETVATEGFRMRATIMVAFLAFALAATGLFGRLIHSRIDDLNSSLEGTLQLSLSKSVRRASFGTGADLMDVLAAAPGASPEWRRSTAAHALRYRQRMAVLASEPDSAHPNDPLKGWGNKELTAQARMMEKQIERLENATEYLDYSELLLQMALVLATIASVSVSRPILILSAMMGAVGTVALVAGHFISVQ